MKSLALILAVVCVAYGNVLNREKREGNPVEDFVQSCPGQCLDQWGDHWAEEYLRRAAQWVDKIDTSEASTLPPFPRDKYDTVCGAGAETLKTCVNNCNSPADAPRKERMMNILRSVKDILCDDAIRSNIECIGQVIETQSATCDTTCQAKQQAVGQAHDQFKASAPDGTGAIDPVKLKVYAEKACEFLNCRLVCRKPEFIQRCQQAGFDAAKTLLSKTATMVQTVHAQYRPPANFPDQCKPEKIVEGA